MTMKEGNSIGVVTYREKTDKQKKPYFKHD
jgi:hypothetical protein